MQTRLDDSENDNITLATLIEAAKSIQVALDELENRITDTTPLNETLSNNNANETTFTEKNLRSAVKRNDIEFVNAYVSHHNNDYTALTKPYKDNGLEAICKAASFGYVEIVDAFIKAGVDINRTRKKSQASPLCFTANPGHTNVAALLIKNGANVNQSFYGCWDPISIATVNGHNDMVGLLIENGAAINKKYPPYDYKSDWSENDPLPKDACCKSLLDLAISDNHIDIAARLLQTPHFNNDINITVNTALKQRLFDDILAINDNKQRQTALENAAGEGEQGNNHPYFKIMSYSRHKIIHTRKSRGFLSKIHHELEKLKSQTLPIAEKSEPSSSAQLVQALTPSAPTLEKEKILFPAWQTQFPDFASIEVFLTQDSLTILDCLNQQDETAQTLREFLFQAARSKPFILYLMLQKELVREIDMACLQNMSAVFIEWLKHPNWPNDIQKRFIAEACNPSTPFYRFLMQDPASTPALFRLQKHVAQQAQTPGALPPPYHVAIQQSASIITKYPSLPTLIPPPSYADSIKALKSSTAANHSLIEQKEKEDRGNRQEKGFAQASV